MRDEDEALSARVSSNWEMKKWVRVGDEAVSDHGRARRIVSEQAWILRESRFSLSVGNKNPASLFPRCQCSAPYVCLTSFFNFPWTPSPSILPLPSPRFLPPPKENGVDPPSANGTPTHSLQLDAGQNANAVWLSLGPGGEPAIPPATSRGRGRPRRSPNLKSELAWAPPCPSAQETITASTGPNVSSRGRGRLKKNAAQRKRGRPPKRKRNANAQPPPQADAGQNANAALCPGGEPAKPPATRRGRGRPRRPPNLKHELAFAPPCPSAPETIRASTGPNVSSRGRGRLKKNVAAVLPSGVSPQAVGRPKKMKAEQLMNKTKGAENGCPRDDEASTSFDSFVIEESDKMKAPQSVPVKRKRGRPHKHRHYADTQPQQQHNIQQNANPGWFLLGPEDEPPKPLGTRRGSGLLPKARMNTLDKSGPLACMGQPPNSTRPGCPPNPKSESAFSNGTKRRPGHPPKNKTSIKMKAQLVKTTKGGKNRCLRVDKASTSFGSSVAGESEKMKAPESMHVQRNTLRRYAPSCSHIKKSPFEHLTGHNLRAKCAPEKSDRTQTLTPRLDVEDVRRHITYRLSQEESQVVERWSCHLFGTTEGDDTRFGAASIENSGLFAKDIQCLVCKGHRDLRKLWLNNDVVHCYGEILMQWACHCPDKEYYDYFISPYAGVVALARRNDGDDLRWVKRLIKGHHNRLLFPCVINYHYVFAVADCLKQKVAVCDSMNSARHKRDAVKVGNWLQRICATVLGYDDSHSWDFVYPKHIPQQVNGHDCGVFVLTYMASIIMCGSIVPFSSEEISGIRHRVLVELSKGQLVAF